MRRCITKSLAPSRSRIMTSILCIHDIVPDTPESPWEIQGGVFEQLLHHLKYQDYQFVGLDDISRHTGRSIVLTIDDAPSGAVDWILQRAFLFDIQVTLFPVVDWLDNPPPRSAEHSYRSLASWQDIKKVSDLGHIIGSHGMSHVPMHNLEEKRLVYELQESMKKLEDRLKVQIKHFSAPYGKLSPQVIDLAFALGYTSICSTIPGNNAVEDPSGSILKRYVVRSDLPKMGLPDSLAKK